MFRVVDHWSPQLLVSGEDLDIDFGDDVDPEDVFDAWHANRTMVPLSGGGWAPLPEDWP